MMSLAILEGLIHAYQTAINERNQPEIQRLIVLVEKEADRVGYDNHTRLANLHTQAENVDPYREGYRLGRSCGDVRELSIYQPYKLRQKKEHDDFERGFREGCVDH
jgi:hypothetical protein